MFYLALIMYHHIFGVVAAVFVSLLFLLFCFCRCCCMGVVVFIIIGVRVVVGVVVAVVLVVLLLPVLHHCFLLFDGFLISLSLSTY